MPYWSMHFSDKRILTFVNVLSVILITKLPFIKEAISVELLSLRYSILFDCIYELIISN